MPRMADLWGLGVGVFFAFPVFGSLPIRCCLALRFVRFCKPRLWKLWGKDPEIELPAIVAD